MGKLVRIRRMGEGSYCHVIRGCDDDDGDFQKRKAPRVVIMNNVNIILASLSFFLVLAVQIEATQDEKDERWQI